MSSQGDPLRTDDPIAERRFAYARGAARDGDFSTAAEVLEQALEADPLWAAAWFALGEARQRLGAFPPARAAFAETLRLDPEDRQGAALRLAALDGREVGALPRAYVTRLFDDYAPRFSAHLTDDLSYRGPAVLFEIVQRLAPGRRYHRALDLGCGSGLVGVVFRGLVDALVGVDLSSAMIEEARRTGVYDGFMVGDVVDFLSAEPAAKTDLILAADLLVYMGDISPLLRAAARALAPDGRFAFTVEAEPGEGFHLGETLRFRHSSAYVLQALEDAGLRALTIEAASARQEAGVAAPGLVVVAGRQAG